MIRAQIDRGDDKMGLKKPTVLISVKTIEFGRITEIKRCIAYFRDCLATYHKMMVQTPPHKRLEGLKAINRLVGEKHGLMDLTWSPNVRI